MLSGSQKLAQGHAAHEGCRGKSSLSHFFTTKMGSLHCLKKQDIGQVVKAENSEKFQAQRGD